MMDKNTCENCPCRLWCGCADGKDGKGGKGNLGAWVPTLIVVFLAIVSLFFAIKTLKEMKAYGYIGKDVPVMKTIVVSGAGEFVAIPDVAQVSFDVIKESKTVAGAQEAATGAMNKALNMLKDQGIEDKDIKTLSYNISPKYDYVKTGADMTVYSYGKQVLAGYTVSQSIQVKIKDVSKAGDVIARLGKEDISNLSGLNFTFEDEDTGKVEARNMAITKAKAEAKKIEQSLGIKLGKIISFSENNYPMYAYGKGGDMVSMTSEVRVPSVPTGETKVTSNVSIVYEIR